MRRLHLTLRIDDANRVTATFRRLWGDYDQAHPVIRVTLNEPDGVSWWWIMRLLASKPHEVSVPDDWEWMTSLDRYSFLRGRVMDLYDARAGVKDKHQPHRRKQGRK